MEHLAKLLYRFSKETDTPLRIEENKIDIYPLLLEAAKKSPHASRLFDKVEAVMK